MNSYINFVLKRSLILPFSLAKPHFGWETIMCLVKNTSLPPANSSRVRVLAGYEIQAGLGKVRI